MNYFLIDYENVHDKEIKELENIKDGDTLIIFYSNQCRKISLDVLDFSKGITYQIFKAFVGTKNALDFQLSSYLGYLIGKNSLQDTKSDANYYIVSNDKGYGYLCDYWQENFSVNVRSSTQATLKEIREALKGVTKDVLSGEAQLEKVQYAFNHNPSKKEINEELSQYFKDNDKVSKIAKKLRPLMEEKHKS